MKALSCLRNPLRRSALSAGVSSAAQNPAKTNTVIPAREIIILWKVPKKIPSSKI